MFDQITNHAKAAAAAHGVAVRVHEYQEFDKVTGKFTGRFGCSVEFHQSVFTRPENKKGSVSEIEKRRIIGVSATDARRLFRSRKGLAGGQEYILTRAARESINHVADSPEEAARVVLDDLLAGLGRSYAHKVADHAATIEVEMREQLRADIEAAIQGKASV